MLFSTSTAIKGLFIICLAVNVLALEPEKMKYQNIKKSIDLMKSKFPAAIVAPSPLGPFLAGGLFSIYKSFALVNGLINNGSFISDMAIIENFVETFEEIFRIGDAFLSRLIKFDEQVILVDLEGTYFDNMDCILSLDCTGTPKNSIVNDMIKSMSYYRSSFSSFISLFLKKQEQNNPKFFFKSFLNTSEYKERNDNDCGAESIHTQYYKAYMYMAGILTNGYSMIAASHAIKYMKHSNAEKSSADGIIKVSLGNIIREYLDYMKELNAEVKQNLKKLHREVRNCGRFKLTKGKTFERLNFLSVRFKLNNIYGFCNEVDEPESRNKKVFEKYDCEPLDTGTLHLYTNKTDSFRPHHHIMLNGKVFGKGGNESSYFHKKITSYPFCKSYRCNSHIPGIFAFSLEPIQADKDHVVTGIRWRVRNGIVAFDIQQGIFMHATQVNSSTLKWKESIINSENVYGLSNISRSIMLDDVVLPTDYYVTGVHMFEKNGIIHLGVTGAKQTKRRYESSSMNFFLNYDNKNIQELRIDGGDPGMAPVNSTNIVMRNKGFFYVNFQTTDFSKDIGRTTIPYIDIREVVTNPPAPINGFGIYHGAVPGYGGFLALNLVAPDLTQQIDEERFDKFAKLFQN